MASAVTSRAFARSAGSGLTACSRRTLSASQKAATFRKIATPQLRKQVSRVGGARCFSASATPEIKKYTEDHEWVELSEDGTTGTIGISEYAAKALGDVVFVELPTPDLEVSQGDSIGAVESVKSASDIMTPISGVILEANNVLEEKPATINQSPEGDGWLAKIQVSKAEELDALMDADGYKKFTEETGESH